MKKFIVQVVAFVTLVTILVFLIGNFSLTDEYIIHKTQKTSYKKIAWNLNLINDHPEQIKGSHIFLGPSLMQGGLCDSTLESHSVKAVNMSVNHTGNEVELFFLKRVVKLEPKKVHLHLSKEKHLNLHPMAPLLYTPITLLRSGQSVNISFIDFLYKRAVFVFDYFVFSALKLDVTQGEYTQYGVVHEHGSFSETAYQSISKEQTDLIFEGPHLQDCSFKLKLEENKGSVGIYIKRFIRALKYVVKNIGFIFNASSQQAFVAEAFELAAKNHVELAELYMPVIADAKTTQEFGHQFYSPRDTRAVESIKNFSFLNRADYWYDMNHLSKKGAITFTKALVLEGIIEPM